MIQNHQLSTSFNNSSSHNESHNYVQGINELKKKYLKIATARENHQLEEEVLVNLVDINESWVSNQSNSQNIEFLNSNNLKSNRSYEFAISEGPYERRDSLLNKSDLQQKFIARRLPIGLDTINENLKEKIFDSHDNNSKLNILSSSNASGIVLRKSESI